MKKRPLGICLFICALTAMTVTACDCEKSSHRERRLAAESAATATGADPEATATPPAHPVDAIPEAEASEVLSQWLTAQNSGNFAAYSSLYASRFSGIKRTQTRTSAYDRAGWMRDRQRMFRQPMTVTASNVHVQTTSANADIAFTQLWSSAGYSDEGPKRISLVRENGALRIATEEMLASAPLGELDAALSGGTFISVPAEGGALMLIAHAAATEATGAPRLYSTDEPYVVVKESAPSVPANFRALEGREVTVVERGRTCVGRITGARIARVIVPHFSVAQAWNGEGDEPSRPMPAAARAAEAWAMGTYTYYAALVATECHAPVAVSFEPIANVQSFTPREPTAAERATIRQAFEGTARFATLENAYRAYITESGVDEDHPAAPAQRPLWAAADPTVVFSHGDRRIATVVHNSESCAGFASAGWASFELEGTAALEHPEPVVIADYISVVAVFDNEGDGNLEAIVRQGLASWALIRIAPSVGRMRMIEVDYLDCPC